MRSAIGETAGNPRRDANLPDVAAAPLDSPGSCGWPITSAPSERAYDNARVSTLVSVITRSQSVKPTAPASSKKPISVISRPARPFVSAAMVSTFTGAASFARLRVNSSVSGVSIAGRVSGRVTMVVTPPAAAACPADLKDSLWRSPGSQTLTPISIIPGASALPPQSMTRAPFGGVSTTAPTDWIKPSLINRLPSVS